MNKTILQFLHIAKEINPYVEALNIIKNKPKLTLIGHKNYNKLNAKPCIWKVGHFKWGHSGTMD